MYFLNVRNYFVKIDGIGYTRESVNVDYNTNKYLDQYRDLKLFYEEHVGEPLLGSYTAHLDIKNFYPTRIIDFGYQLGLITHKQFKYVRKI